MYKNVAIDPPNPLLPDQKGFFGDYGGRFVPEILRPNLLELERLFEQILATRDFWDEYYTTLQQYSGRPTPVTHAKNLSRELGGAQIYLKREDLNHTGAHKVNNVIGQGLVAKRLRKTRVIAETGAGQHGVATATMAARMGFEACIYMGAEDVERQRPNVFWMERLGARVVSVESGTRTLKDAINEALRDWSANFQSTHYVLGTACGPHPFPALVAYLQSAVGLEAKQQMKQWYQTQPSRVYACVGGGSNALGLYQGFLESPDVEFYAVEAGGRGDDVGEHACRLSLNQASKGIAQGYLTLFLQNEEGQMLDTHSIAAGLDYVGVSPILADLKDKGRLNAARVSDKQVLEAVQLCIKTEGIIPALESAHAVAAAMADAPKCSPKEVFLVNLSGRGDKDIFQMAEALGDESWQDFLRSKLKKGRE